MTYTVEQLAPGSYDVFLDGCLIAALVRDASRRGASDEWQIDLLEETPLSALHAPFTAQSHAFRSRGAALEWLGISHERDGPSQAE
jgi:hypothetical protein